MKKRGYVGTERGVGLKVMPLVGPRLKKRGYVGAEGGGAANGP